MVNRGLVTTHARFNLCGGPSTTRPVGVAAELVYQQPAGQNNSTQHMIHMAREPPITSNHAPTPRHTSTSFQSSRSWRTRSNWLSICCCEI
eukprot:3194010-Amphidinium_carterae.1